MLGLASEPHPNASWLWPTKTRTGGHQLVLANKGGKSSPSTDDVRVPNGDFPLLCKDIFETQQPEGDDK